MSWRNIRFARFGLLAMLAAAFLPGSIATVAAHEIPSTATVQAFIRPEGDRLQLLMRVPLAAMRDIDWPVRGPGFLEVAESQRHYETAAKTWLVDYVSIYENGRLLGDERIVSSRISIPSDASFLAFESAMANLSAPPIAEGIDMMWDQGLFDVLIEYPIASATSDFSIDPEWAHLGIRTTTILRFLPAGGSERIFQYQGLPGLVRLDPRWHQAAFTFVVLGFEHILEGLDHLLFVFCLVIPFRRFRPLVAVITSFTVAHSITLMAAAFGLAPSALWFPPLIETLIALSIVWMAFENIVGVNIQRRWMMAFGFGLIHGFGFSFLLTESLQYAGTHLLTSLLAFNVGVELGQIFVLALAIPLLTVLFRKVVEERMGTIILSALVAHTSWHWMTERGSELLEYQFVAPAFDAALLASTMRWGMLILIILGIAWMLYEIFGRLVQPGPRPGVEG
jgi:hypothetical protein